MKHTLRVLLFFVCVGSAIAWYLRVQSERQAAERNIDTRVELLTALEETHTGLIQSRDTGDGIYRIVSATPAACDIFGYSDSEMIGLPVSDLVPHFMQDVHNERMRQARSAMGTGARPWTVASIRCDGTRKDGGVVSVWLRILMTNDSAIAILNRSDEVFYSPGDGGAKESPSYEVMRRRYPPKSS